MQISALQSTAMCCIRDHLSSVYRKLQLVQNLATGLLSGISIHEHIKTVMHNLLGQPASFKMLV